MRPDSSIHWTAYPALLVAAAFSAGIVADTLVAPVIQTGSRLWFAIAGLGMGMAAAAWLWEQRRLVSLAPLLRVFGLSLLVVGSGGLCAATYRTPAPDSVRRVVDANGEADLHLTGTVSTAPEHHDGRTRFTLDIDRTIEGRDSTTASGRVHVTLAVPPWDDVDASFPDVHEGDRLALQGTIETPPQPRVPGAFDYGAYLARRGICCTAWIGDPADVRVVDGAASMFTRAVVATREHVRRQIDATVPSAGARGVLQALLLGDRSALSSRREEEFASTGLMHLLAVSGLHVLLVGMVLYGLLRPLLMRLRLRWKPIEITRALLTISVLGLYLALTGARPSVVRAVVMASLLIGGIVLQRSSHALNTLGVAALLLLTLRPPALFDAGFQLSMAAVAGIVTLHPRATECIPESWTASGATEWLVSMISVSAAATAATLPVLLHHFGQASLAGLVLNIPAIPLTTLALSAGVLAVVVGGVWPAAGAVFGVAADVLVRGLLATASTGATWMNGATLHLTNPDPWVLAALAGLVIVAA